MIQINCDTCGGSVRDPATVSYRLASGATVTAQPHDAPCACAVAIVYGPPAGYMSWPGMPVVKEAP
jgi:hypothetical protein